VNVCVIGRGKVGRALSAALRAEGVAVKLVAGRNERAYPKGFDTYLLAVPDPHIAEAALRLSHVITRGDVVIHLSGSRPESELDACKTSGAQIAVAHPQVSFASGGARPSLRKATFVARGDRRAVARMTTLAKKLGARCVQGPAGEPAYHAAAALLANGSVALAQLAADILSARGMSQGDATQALSGLLRSVADNLEQVGLPDALTGPIARGDAPTVRAHVTALRALDAELAQGYASLIPWIVRTARAQGLTAGAAENILREAEAPLTARDSRRRQARG
jgi:predicted short-subunit dehydrogenase-like oxidoreductase (DUF2520 family)